MRLNRVMLSLLGAAMLVLLMLAFVNVFATDPVALNPRSVLAAPLAQSSPVSVTLMGPDAVLANEVVTYRVHLTIPVSFDEWLLVEYHHPVSFTVTSVDPVTSSQGGTVLAWDKNRLAGRDLITVTGRHSNEGCPPVTHAALAFVDYAPSSLDSMDVVVGGCLYLPVTLRNYP